MSQPNKFLAAGLKKGERADAPPPADADAPPQTPAEAPQATPAAQAMVAPAEPPKARQKPSRVATKHIGGYFDPAVSRQLRQIGVEEDATVQDLLAEAIDLLFQSRQRPTIAKKPAA
jgi:hypothetical protein